MRTQSIIALFNVLSAFVFVGCNNGDSAAPPVPADLEDQVSVRPAANDTEWKIESVEDGLPDWAYEGQANSEEGLGVSTQALTTQCKTVTYGANGRNAVGNLLYSMALTVGFCYDGVRVTYHSHRITNVRTNTLWVNLGTSSAKQDGPNMSFVQAWGDGTFALCAASSYGCIDYGYPHVEITVHGNGTFSGWADPG